MAIAKKGNNMKKRILSIFLAAVMVLSMIHLVVFTIVASGSETGGDGVVKDANGNVAADEEWYDANVTDLYIWDVSDMLAYGKEMANHDNFSSDFAFDGQVIHIMADLDMSEVANWFDYIKRGRVFSGIIDGHGHTISNLKWNGVYDAQGVIDRENTYGGLLGGLIVPGTDTAPNSEYNAYAGVFDLSIVDSSIQTGGFWAGSLFGAAHAPEGSFFDTVEKPCVFENIYVDVDVTTYAETKYKTWTNADTYETLRGAGVDGIWNNAYVGSAVYVGGLIGACNYGTDTIINDTVFAGSVVVADNTFTDCVGGFVGEVLGISENSKSTFKVSNSAMYGTVNVKSSDYKAAVVGVISNDVTADNIWFDGCISAGTIKFGGPKNSHPFTNPSSGDAKVGISNCYYAPFFVNETKVSFGTKVSNSRFELSNNTEVATSDSLKTVSIEGYVNMPNEATLPVPVGVVNMVRGTSENKTQYLGYQIGTDSIRFVAGGDDTTYTSVGFDVSVFTEGTLVSGGIKHDTTTVYSSVQGTVNGVDKTYSSTEFGVNYLYTIICENIPANKEITFVVKTYHVADTDTVYDDVYVITVGNAS